MLKPAGHVPTIAALLLLFAATASAQSGKEDYQHYCAACHALDGRGKGTWRGTEIPDLTGLSQKNGGVFPSSEVAEVVDGRSRALWHQHQRDMPYWGELFQLEAGNPAAKEQVQARIAAIVDYVRSLQKK